MLICGRLTPADLQWILAPKKQNKCLEHRCYADIANITLVERPEAADDGVALRADQRLSLRQSIKYNNSNRRNRKYTCQDVRRNVDELLITQ